MSINDDKLKQNIIAMIDKLIIFKFSALLNMLGNTGIGIAGKRVIDIIKEKLCGYLLINYNKFLLFQQVFPEHKICLNDIYIPLTLLDRSGTRADIFTFVF